MLLLKLCYWLHTQFRSPVLVCLVCLVCWSEAHQTHRQNILTCIYLYIQVLLLVTILIINNKIHGHHHHKHQGLDPLICSVSTVTTALSNVSLVFQLFSFLVVCSGMISKAFGFVTFFASESQLRLYS